MLIEAAKSCLLIVDMQERLLPVIHEATRVADNCATLIEAAEKLDLPIILSEQYPKGLGPTVPELENKNAMIFDKLAFSVWRNDTLKAHFKNRLSLNFRESEAFDQSGLCFFRRF